MRPSDDIEELELEGRCVMLAGREVRIIVAEVAVCPCESVVVIKAVTSILNWVPDGREKILPEGNTVGPKI